VATRSKLKSQIDTECFVEGRVLGLDFVELTPARDINEISSIVAGRIRSISSAARWGRGISTEGGGAFHRFGPHPVNCPGDDGHPAPAHELLTVLLHHHAG
jgi:hypothetical protein